jgi:Flp pilus assembly protein CpaB
VTTQRALLVLAILAGAVSGAIYYSASARVGVLFATTHLSPGRPIGEGDVEFRWLPADAVPPDALTDTVAAIGHFPRGPMWPGQVLLAGSLARASATFESGLVPPTGYRAVAIPVAAHQALGGAIAPGARVDVIAVPLPGREQVEALAELLTEAALVIDVRGEYGGPIAGGEPSRSAIAAPERLGSVVIAVGASEELMIAERIATRSFVLVLVPPLP